MRTEKDSLGERLIAEDAYHGIQSLRAMENFPISGLRPHPTFIRAYALLKQACLHANVECGVFQDADAAAAIEAAAIELARGVLTDHIVVDVFQAGAGTSTNMNVNEVIANRALERLGDEKGNYERISPNDHVNMSQSTNDTYPTAMRVAILLIHAEKLDPALQSFEQTLRDKSKEFEHLVKSARTHMQDAVPMTLGQEFGAWAEMVLRHRVRIEQACEDLSHLGIGGSAAGTGLNTPPAYREKVVRALSTSTGLSLEPSRNLFEAMQSLAPFVHYMSAIKNLALDLLKISHDLRLLASGPMTGFAEIALPAVQPGSSIMPGKVNPSILEMLSQVCMQIVGAEAAVAMSSQAGQLELNVMMPGVQYNCMFATDILSNALVIASKKCIAGITADSERMRYYAETSGSLVTALAPAIGYLEAARLAKESLATRRTIRELVLEQALLPAEELDRLLDIGKMASGSPDQ